MRAMRNAFLLLALSAPAAAGALVAAPRVAAPVIPVGALARPNLGTSVSLTPSLRLSAPNLAPSLTPTLAPALAPAAVTAPLATRLPAPAFAAAPAADAPSAKGSLVSADEALSAPRADQGSVSRRVFDAGVKAPNDAPSFGPLGLPSFRAPDGFENQRIANAVSYLSPSRTPIGADLYAKAYNDYGARLSVLVDDDHNASYDARLYWKDGSPVLSLTRDLLSRGSDAAVAAFLVRELSHLYYKDFPDSTERSWMAHSAMVRTFAEITNSGRDWWDRSNDLDRGGRYVVKAFYDSWRDALRSNDPRYGTFFNWLKSGSDSKSGPNSGLSLREQYDRGLISWQTYNQMNQYFGTLVDSERRWLNARF